MANTRSTFTIAAIVALLFLTTAGTAKASTGPLPDLDPVPDPTPEPEGCDPGTYLYVPGDVIASIYDAIDDGMRTDMKVAVWVATDIWPNDAWPPYPGASAHQKCAWSMLVAEIERVKIDEGIPPWPDCDGDETVLDGECVGPQPIPLDPWLNEDPKWPLPGTFYEVEAGDILLGTNPGGAHSIVYSTLLSAAYKVAVEIGNLEHEAAIAFAQSVAYDPEARLDYMYLILCSPWNDALYGTHGYDAAYIGNFDSNSGRALRLQGMHYDNYDRIRQGIPPKRNIRLGNPSTPGDKSGTPMNGAQLSYEFLWLPAINLQKLWSSQGQDITTEGMEWEDGSTVLMPPPIVANLLPQNVPAGLWGCTGDYQLSTEDL